MALISPAHLQHAYRRGWFPMGDEAGRLEWVQPHRRALFPLTGMRVSRLLRRKLADVSGPGAPTTGQRVQIRIDTAFRDVMLGCLRPEDNWITPEIIDAFCDAHAQGWAHSFEVWRGAHLVGGLYGLAIGRIFSAESMFHRETDCSKIALWAAIEHCCGLGFEVFDAQIQNPHLESLGAFEISTAEYETLLLQHAYINVEWSNLTP